MLPNDVCPPPALHAAQQASRIQEMKQAASGSPCYMVGKRQVVISLYYPDMLIACYKARAT
ncbi:MAG: hypothetical protein ACRDHW_11445, partial [Ktedonobacteraceae bacterium]